MQKAITNIDKKIFFIFLSILFPAALSAQEAGLQGITSTAEGVGNYIPVVQGLCFVIAAAIGIAGSVYAYYQVQKGEQPEKYVVGTVGSAMTFVVMALFLPQFFGYTSSPSEGLIAQNSGSGGSDSTSAIDTEIPDISDLRWTEDYNADGLIKKYISLDENGNSRGLPNLRRELLAERPYIDDDREWLSSSRYNSAAHYIYANPDYADFTNARASITQNYLYYLNKNNTSAARIWGQILDACERYAEAAAYVTWWEYSGTKTDPPTDWLNKF